MYTTHMVMNNNDFTLHSLKQHSWFVGLSAFFVAIAFIVVQMVTQLDGWFFGAALALGYWLSLMGFYLFIVLALYLLRGKLRVNAQAFMKYALSASFFLTFMMASYVLLDIFTRLTPY